MEGYNHRVIIDKKYLWGWVDFVDKEMAKKFIDLVVMFTQSKDFYDIQKRLQYSARIQKRIPISQTRLGEKPL